MPYKPPRGKCVHCYAWLVEYDPRTNEPTKARPGVQVTPQHRSPERPAARMEDGTLGWPPDAFMAAMDRYAEPGGDDREYHDPVFAWPAAERPPSTDQPPWNYWVAKCTKCKKKTGWKRNEEQPPAL